MVANGMYIVVGEYSAACVYTCTCIIAHSTNYYEHFTQDMCDTADSYALVLESTIKVT